MKYIEYSKQLKLSYGYSLSFSFGCCFPIKVGKITILMVQRINIRLGIFPVECSHNIDAPDGLSGNSFAIASLSTSHLHLLECIALHWPTKHLLSRKDHNAAGNALPCTVYIFAAHFCISLLHSILLNCGLV